MLSDALLHRVILYLLVLIGCTLFSSCSLITKTAVNKKIPARSLEAIRIKNLEAQTYQLERLVHADVGIHLASSDLDSVLDVGLQKWFGSGQNFNIPAIERVNLKRHEISFGPQSVRVDALIDVAMTKDQAPGRYVKSSRWRLQILLSPGARDSTLHLTASVLNVKIERLKLRGIFHLLWVVKPVFNSLAVTLRDNINGYLEQHPIIIPLKIEPLPHVKIRDIVSSGQLAVVGEPEIHVNKVLGAVAIRVDATGIDLLAQMVDAKDGDKKFSFNRRYESHSVSEDLRKPLKRELFLKAYHCKKVLDQVGSSQIYFDAASQYASSTSHWVRGKLRKSDIPVFPHQLQLPEIVGKSLNVSGGNRCRDAKERLRQEAPRGDRRQRVNELFDQYYDLFQAKMLTSLDSFHHVGNTEVQLSKQFITSVFNEVFADPNIVFTYQQDFKFEQTPVNIELIDKPNFTCSSVLENCSNRLRNCNNAMRNCGSCSRWNIICKAKKAVCHVGNGIKWAACQVGNGATYAACQVENVGKYAWCSTVFLVEYALHEALKVGTYAGRGDVHIDGKFSLLQAGLDENLKQYRLTTNVIADGDFDVQLLFDGEGLVEWLLCQGINCRLQDGFQVSQVNPIISGAIHVNHVPGSSDQLIFQVPEIQVRLELDNPLIQSFIRQCRGMFVSCKVSRILLFSFALYLIDNPSIRNYLNALWKGKYDHTIEPFDITLDIPPMQLPGGWGVAYASVQKRSVSLLFNP